MMTKEDNIWGFITLLMIISMFFFILKWRIVVGLLIATTITIIAFNRGVKNGKKRKN